MLLPERSPKHRQILPVHAVQHDLQHLLHRAPWSRPGDVAVAQLFLTGRGAALKSGRAALLIPALPGPSGLFLLLHRSRQILLVLPLQPLKQLLVALLFPLSLLPNVPPFQLARRREPLNFCVLFRKVLSPDTIGPVPKVFLVVVDRKIIVGCERKTAGLFSGRMLK